MPARKAKNTHYLVWGGVALLALVALIVALQPSPGPLSWLIRGAALIGYLTIFLAILSSAYLVPLVRFFGRPFIKVHHVSSIAGLVAMLVLPRVKGFLSREKTTVERRSGKDRRQRNVRVPVDRRRRGRRQEDVARSFVEGLTD
jgi:hypothetical protein